VILPGILNRSIKTKDDKREKPGEGWSDDRPQRGKE
jgi:hypothetical protein